MASATPAKSILKQPRTQPTEDDAAAAQAEKDQRNLNIALKHAYLIQHQRDTQARILKNIETLLDFPPHTPPTPSDAKAFLSMVSLFQPSDIDDLVEERRIDVKCGYSLCGNKPRSYGLKDSETWKLKRGAGDWCSNSCARKALFVKTQLSEVPAWERVPGQQPEVKLHEDDSHLLPVSEMEGDVNVARVQQRIAERDELALERGERGVSIRPGQVMAETIVEKVPEARRAQKEGKVKFESATAVEGYEPGSAAEKNTTGKALYESDDEEQLDVGLSGPATPLSSDDGEEEDEDAQFRDMFASLRTRDKVV